MSPVSRSQAAAAAHQMDEDDVREAYRRWAPVYDYTFGRISTAGRRHAVELINASSGKVLEVGVGTGLSLPEYKSHLDITGIDLAPEMLQKARERVKAHTLLRTSWKKRGPGSKSVEFAKAFVRCSTRAAST